MSPEVKAAKLAELRVSVALAKELDDKTTLLSDKHLLLTEKSELLPEGSPEAIQAAADAASCLAEYNALAVICAEAASAASSLASSIL